MVPRPIPPQGQSFPLGATVVPGGANFSVFSKYAECVEVLLFDHVEADKPSQVITLEASKNRTYHYWHVLVPGVGVGQAYGFRAKGPWNPAKGLRFDGDKLLLDPYARCVAPPKAYDRAASMRPGPNLGAAMKCLVTDTSTYDWEGDAPLGRHFRDTVIYEMHVKGFTRHPSSGVSPERRGTFCGIIDKIPYLQELGVTAIELMPVFQFDVQDAPAGRTNYWGYSPVSFFAPHQAYGASSTPLGVLDEFRDMVKTLHRAGIEVILDVVYNHTAEGGADGPTFCYRGLANDAYYLLESDRADYADYSGCGNTMNANQSVVRRMILDSLRYWVGEMHVDGFRFDLASILSRDEDGRPLQNPPILWDIESDPILAGTKLIAEAWDAAGLYQVGSFVGDSWEEWNGKFRDDVRAFLKSDKNTVERLKLRVTGSPDLYEQKNRAPSHSVNFITCHDGFTLNDLVSYNRKHNEANGEDNRDGSDYNLSWNCGVEGPTDDPAIEALRTRQIKNALAIVFLSVGTPMILMGDEFRRTQGGNNNAYCQDNEISWVDWSFLDRYPDIHRFTRTLIYYRRIAGALQDRFGLTLHELLHHRNMLWHGTRLGEPDWSEHSHSLAFTALALGGSTCLHVIFNAYWEALDFEIPRLPSGRVWHRFIDTSLPPPHDVAEFFDAARLTGDVYTAAPRSVVGLLASS